MEKSKSERLFTTEAQRAQREQIYLNPNTKNEKLFTN